MLARGYEREFAEQIYQQIQGFGVDGRTELSLCLVPVGFGQASREAAAASDEPAAEIIHAVGQMSFRSREYDEVLEAAGPRAR